MHQVHHSSGARETGILLQTILPLTRNMNAKIDIELYYIFSAPFYVCADRYVICADLFFTNARKIYYHLRVSIARFLITLTGNLDI